MNTYTISVATLVLVASSVSSASQSVPGWNQYCGWSMEKPNLDLPSGAGDFLDKAFRGQVQIQSEVGNMWYMPLALQMQNLVTRTSETGTPNHWNGTLFANCAHLDLWVVGPKSSSCHNTRYGFTGMSFYDQDGSTTRCSLYEDRKQGESQLYSCNATSIIRGARVTKTIATLLIKNSDLCTYLPTYEPVFVKPKEVNPTVTVSFLDNE